MVLQLTLDFQLNIGRLNTIRSYPLKLWSYERRRPHWVARRYDGGQAIGGTFSHFDSGETKVLHQFECFCPPTTLSATSLAYLISGRPTLRPSPLQNSWSPCNVLLRQAISNAAIWKVDWGRCRGRQRLPLSRPRRLWSPWKRSWQRREKKPERSHMNDRSTARKFRCNILPLIGDCWMTMRTLCCRG